MKINEVLARPRTQDSQSILIPNPSPKDARKGDTYVKAKIAYLINRYKSPGYENLFRKAVEKLPESTINRIIGMSEGKRSPRAYFIASVKKEGDYNV